MIISLSASLINFSAFYFKKMNFLKKIYHTFIKELLAKSISISMELFKIMIPMLILTKILEYFNMIEFLGKVLKPVMGLMNLDGELGLVWAAAMLTNIYGGLSVFAGIYPGLDITTADITVLCVLILVAHSFPVELGISKKAGVKVFPMLLWRAGSAFIMGIFLSFIFKNFNLLDSPCSPVWKLNQVEKLSFDQWIISQCKGLFYIFIIILILVILMDILEKSGIMEKLTRKIVFFISPLGMGKNAGFLTVTGFILGISYGGGLIITEAETGTLTQREIFLSLSLMGLSHGMIEDTLLMAAIGGSFWGILVGRVVFSFIFMWLLAKITSFLSEKNFSSFFMSRSFRTQP